MKPNTRPPWVWTALSLQFVLASISLFSCTLLLPLLTRHATWETISQSLYRGFIPGATATASLVGLWRTRRWGWRLALLADGIMCVQDLWFLLNYPTVLLRHPRFLAFDIWEFAALAILLYRPVMEYFLAQHPTTETVARPPAQPWGGPAAKPWGLVIYFAVAVISTCVVTAFALAVFMGHKNPGSGGFKLFVVLLYFAFMTGCGASFLFALILTLLVRKLDPIRLWPWLLLGGPLAPSLIFVLAFIGLHLGPGPWNIVFQGPETLLRGWWLTAPIGIVTGWICYTMYPRCVSLPGR